jgi:transposase
MSAITVRAQWTPEERAEALRRLAGGQSIKSVALGLCIPRSTLGNWARQSHAEALYGQGGTPAAVRADQLEITRLRAEISRLQVECDTAKQVAKHFAQIVQRVLRH